MRWLLLAIVAVGCRDTPVPAPPVIAISLVYAGADAVTIEKSVVLPVESAVGSVPGLHSIVSRIEADHATVMLELAPGASIDRVSHDVRHALAEVQPTLPSAIAPPVVTHGRGDDAPVLLLAVRGTLPIGVISSQVNDVVKPRFERIPGVRAVELHNLAELTVIVRPDLAKLDAVGATLFDVLAAIRAVDEATIETLGETVVLQRADAAIRLRDVALIESGYERDGEGEPTIAIRAQDGASASAVVRAVRDDVKALAPELPSGMLIAETAAPAKRPPPQVTVSLRGPDLGELRRRANSIVADLAKEAITDVVLDPPEGQPEQAIVPDRDHAAQLGIPIADLFATLRAVGRTQVGAILIEGKRSDVVMRMPSDSVDSALEHLRVRATTGQLVPLSAVVTTTTSRSVTIVRRDRERSITLSIYAPAALVSVARETATARELPPGYHAIVSR